MMGDKATARLTAIAAALVLLCTAGAAKAQELEPIGPEGSAITCIRFHPTDPKMVYMGNEGAGGVYVSGDAARTFQPATDRIPNVGACAVVVDPNDPRRIYCGDPNGAGFYESADGGKSWRFSNSGLETRKAHIIHDVSTYKDRPGWVVVATADGVFMRDRGRRWEMFRALPIDTEARRVTLYFDGVIVGTHNGKLLFCPRLNEEWEDVRPERMTRFDWVTDIRTEPRWAGTIWLATANPQTGLGYVYKSTDTPKEWERMRLVESQWVTRVVPMVSDRQKCVYLAYWGKPRQRVLWRSITRGRTWVDCTGRLDVSAVLSLGVNPHDYNHVILGTRDGIFTSRDAGANWHRDDFGIRATCVNAVLVDIDYQDTLYVGLDDPTPVARKSYLRKTENGGGHWRPLPLDAPVSCLAFSGAGRSRKLLIGTRGAGLWSLSERGGRTADRPRQERFGEATCTALLSLGQDRSTILAAVQGRGGGLYRSTDAGRRWARVGSTAPTVLAGVEGDSERVLAGGRGVSLSTNGGKRFKAIGLAAEHVSCLAANPKDPNVVLAGTEHGCLFLTTDGGRKWERPRFAAEGRGRISALAFAPSGDIYAGVEAPGPHAEPTVQGLFRTRDGGKTWQCVSSAMWPSQHVHCLALDPRAAPALYAGTRFGGAYRLKLTP